MKRINSDGPKLHQYQQNLSQQIMEHTKQKSTQRTTWEIPVLHICSLEQA